MSATRGHKGSLRAAVVGLGAGLLIACSALSADAAVFQVNSMGDEPDAFLGDGVAEIAPGSAVTTLRAAIEEANSFPGADVIYVPAGAIKLKSALPPLSDLTGGTAIIGTTRVHPVEGEFPYTITRLVGGTRLDGNTLDTALEGYAETTGLRIVSAGNVIQGLQFVNFPQDGIEISGSAATSNTVRACYIGLKGFTPEGNKRHGVLITGGASDNTVGGESPLERNLIGDNRVDGIHISGTGTQGNRVIGNFLGCTVLGVPECVEDVLSGQAELTDGCRQLLAEEACKKSSFPNWRNNVGISGGASNNEIGSESTVNVISGSQWMSPCVRYVHPAYCEVDPELFPLTRGGMSGIVVEGEGTVGNRILGNEIGVRHAWNVEVVGDGYMLVDGYDRSGAVEHSIALLDGASRNVIGGDGEAGGNVIDYSLKAAVLVSGGGTTENQILGNSIQGEKEGVHITGGASANQLGSAGSGGNSIRSREHAVALSGSGTEGNVVQGNQITNTGFSGVAIFGGASMNRIGGSAPGEGNEINFNCSDGIILHDPETAGNQILGNEIYGNGEIGVFLLNGASGNIIGGGAPGAGNDIYDNDVTGVEIHDIASTNNQILGNEIYRNGTRGVLMVDGTSGNIVGGEPLAERKKIYENALSGIEINGAHTFENQIRLNSIYDNHGKGILLSFGANRAIVPPVIETFVPFAGSAPPNSFVDIFSDSAEEGKVYIGSTSTDEDGQYTVQLDLASYLNTNLTSTATDSSGNTSEFSAPLAIVPPVFTEAPADRVVVEGDDFALAVTVTGSPEIRYQWRFRNQAGDYVDLADGESAAGSKTSTLSFLSVPPGAQGYYQCVADNGLGGVNSREIYVRVVDAGLRELEVNTLEDGSDGNLSSFARLLADPGLDGQVSLREALAAANAMSGENTIRFSVEGVIQPESPLPPISDTTGGLTLDGMDALVLDGALLHGTGSGLTVTSGGNHIKRLGIYEFPENGIVLSGESATENEVLDCQIGTDGITDRGNGINGVLITGGARENQIGGTAPGESNHIAGNGNAGIALTGSGTAENRITGNILGESSGHLPEGGNLVAGVLMSEGASDNRIGGDEPGSENLISGNAGVGVYIVGGATGRNTVVGNRIFGNADLGIRLFEGGNENVNRPEIAVVSPLSGTAPPHSRVDCYIDDEDEGAQFLASFVADGAGSFGASLDLGDFDGRYLTAIATDTSGNTSAFSRRAPVDFTPPVLALLGAAELSMECGDSYVDSGAGASDNIDGNINDQIMARILSEGGELLERLDGAPVGIYTITYAVSDSAGLAAQPVSRTVHVVDTTPPTLTLIGASGLTLGYGEEFDDPGTTTSDRCDAEVVTKVTGVVDVATPGVYALTYVASDSAGNSTPPATRTITVEDRTAPALTLIGPEFMDLECGEIFLDPGAMALDDCGGEVPVLVSGSVNAGQIGQYVLTYRASDGVGNQAVEVSRTVTVADSTPPVLRLIGDAELTLQCGEGYVERGAFVDDACDAVARVSIHGDFDSNIAGVYVLYYDATDASGNVAETVTRTITVVGQHPPEITLTGAASITVACGAAYLDAGASAVDGCQTDISSAIIASNLVNTDVPGVYTITYNVADATGATAPEVIRTVTVLPCVTPCDAQCTGEAEDQIDEDGDGLSACKERCAGTSDSDPDTDNDGMPDGFEYRFQLNLRANDADVDLDFDGLTNLEEYLEGGSPRNAATPVRSYFVSAGGLDVSTAGTAAMPWQSIGYALARLESAPAGRKQLFIDSGVYEGDITLPAGLTLRAVPESSVEIMGTVVTSRDSVLRDVTVTSNAADTALLFVSSGNAAIINCLFNGEYGQGLTGVVVEAGDQEGSAIEGCVFKDLVSGIRVEGALPHVRQCQFIRITGAGIVITPEAILPDDSLMGEGLNGWNDFSQIGDGFAIANQSARVVGARWNEWGTEDTGELSARVEGEVDQANVLSEGEASTASALEVVVFNSKSQARIRNAHITLNGSGGALNGITSAEGRLAFPVLNAGTWQVSVTASGFPELNETISLEAGSYRVLNFAMLAKKDEEPIGSGCPTPAKSDHGNRKGDLMLLGLLLGCFYAGHALRRITGEKD